MIAIRGGAGLGDAIYQRPIVERFVARGEQVTVCNSYPDVFLGSGAKVEPFRRDHIDVLAHYTAGKQNPATTQWQDLCNRAGVDAPLRITWRTRNAAMIAGLRKLAGERPLLVVHGGRAPMGRSDGFGRELLPQREAFAAALAALGDCFTVQVGQAVQIYPLECDVTMNGCTSVADLIDLGQACDGIVGQCSFAVPLAEVFDKPALFVWAARGMESGRHPYIRSITPRKVLSKATSGYVMDNWTPGQIEGGARAFRESL